MNNPESYSRVTLPALEPIISDARRDEIIEQSHLRLHFWTPYNNASDNLRKLHKSVLALNIENALKHSRNDGIGDSSIRGAAQGPRPHTALYSGAIRGFGGVELMAALPSSDDEPHNALSRVPLMMGRTLMGKDWEATMGQPRSRIKVTRYFPEGQPSYAVVSTKIDQHSVLDTESGHSFGVKSRRSGYVTLDQVDGDIQTALDTLINMEEQIPNQRTIDMARHAILEFLSDAPSSYNAVVDRVYATK